MPKSPLAEKNNEKKNLKEKNKKSTGKKNIQPEIVEPIFVDFESKTKSKKNNPIIDVINIDKQKNLHNDENNLKQDVLTPDVLDAEEDNSFENIDKEDFSLEELDDEGLENEDFDLTSSNDFIFNNVEHEQDFFSQEQDDFGLNQEEQRTYALPDYNHSDKLPIPHIKNLPSTFRHDNLQLYIREISKFPLLSPEEELELSRKVRDDGDSSAAFRIISAHLRLVVKVAMSFQRRWMQNVLDLIQEGNVGLMRAINKFDPDKGIKFSYYATFWVKAYILKYIMDNWRMVKIGTTQAQRKLFYNLNKERQKLIAQGFDPDVNALSDALGVSVDQVVEMQQRLNTSDMSLDMPVNDEYGSASKVDFFPTLGPGIEDNYAQSEMARLIQDQITNLLPELSDKEIFILNNRLLTDDPVTLREIGEKYNVTRERIRQLEARLLVKLRNHLGDEIKDFSESWIQN